VYLLLEASQHRANLTNGVKDIKKQGKPYPAGLSDIEKQVWDEGGELQPMTGKTQEVYLKEYQEKQRLK
jgi:hypothetical protein